MTLLKWMAVDTGAQDLVLMKVVTKFEVMRTDYPTKNGNIYPELVVRKALKQVAEEKRTLLVHLCDKDAHDNETIGACFKSTVENGRWMAEITVHNDYIENRPFADITVPKLTPCGVATSTFRPDGIREIKDDYVLTGWSLIFEVSPTKLALKKYRQSTGRRSSAVP